MKSWPNLNNHHKFHCELPPWEWEDFQVHLLILDPLNFSSFVFLPTPTYQWSAHGPTENTSWKGSLSIAIPDSGPYWSGNALHWFCSSLVFFAQHAGCHNCGFFRSTSTKTKVPVSLNKFRDSTVVFCWEEKTTWIYPQKGPLRAFHPREYIQEWFRVQKGMILILTFNDIYIFI